MFLKTHTHFAYRWPGCVEHHELYFCSTFSMPLGSAAAGHGHDEVSVSVLR